VPFLSDIEGDEVDSGIGEQGGVAAENVGVSRVVVSRFRLTPMVEDAGSGELGTWGGHDFGEIMGAGGRVGSEPDEVKDANFAVFFDWSGFFVERERPAEMIGGGPGSLAGQGGGEDDREEGFDNHAWRNRGLGF